MQIALDLARASDVQVEGEAKRLVRAVEAARARVAGAESALAAADAGLGATRQRLEQVSLRSEATRRALVGRAVQSYMHPFEEQAAMFTGIGDVNDYARRQMLIRAVNGRDADALDAYRQSRLELAAATADLRRARTLAQTRAMIENEEATQLASAQASAASTHAELQRRIAGLAQESRSLAAQEAGLEALIQSQQAAERSALPGAGPRVAGLPPGGAPGRGTGLIWPVHGPVTSEYGPRWGSFHPGMDIAAAYATPVHASAGGVVIFAGWYGGYGNFVVIDHGAGTSTAYAHQSALAVSQGEAVSQGQVIGYEGSTGDSTGPHVHFEVRINSRPQNPRDYVPASP